MEVVELYKYICIYIKKKREQKWELKVCKTSCCCGSIATGELHHKPKLYKYHAAAFVFLCKKERKEGKKEIL